MTTTTATVKSVPTRPLPEDCSQNAPVTWPSGHGFAAWYPQMGGYVGRCVVDLSRRGTTMYSQDGVSVERPGRCFDVYLWHDGEFPFPNPGHTDETPVRLHFCDPLQFVEFGNLVGLKMFGQALATNEMDLTADEEVAMLRYLAAKHPGIMNEICKAKT
jgi:hypothetical protein